LNWRSALGRAPVVGFLALGALLVLVINPLARLLLASVQDAATGGLTVQNYLAAYGRAASLEAAANSLLVGLSAAAVGLLFGLPMAWAVSRTDMPAKRLVGVAILGTFIVPPYLGAIAWTLLAGPGAGWLNRFYVWLTGAAAGPFDVFGLPGLVLVVACYSFPYVFVFTRSALDRVPPAMEEAARTLGAGPARVTLRVTAPLVLPAILGAVIVEFLQAIALFGVPAVIALRGRFHLMTTMLWQGFAFPPSVQAAAAYAVPLWGVTVLLFGLERRLMRRASAMVVRATGEERRVVRLGRWRWVMLAYCLVVTSLSFFLPIAAVLQAAFAKAWGRGPSLDNLTLGNLRFVLLDHPATQAAALDTIVYGAAAAAIALCIGGSIAYVVERRLVPFVHILSALAMAPLAIPGVVLAVGLYAAYAAPPVVAYGTAGILILAFATRFLPIAYGSGNAAVRDVCPELEDAVRMLRGNRPLALARVTAPLLGRGLAGGFVLVFIAAIREVSSAIFLYGPGNRVLSVALFDGSAGGGVERLASIGLVLVGVTAALVLIGWRVLGRGALFERETA
jgi:iron(III) transport system permease protein